MVLTNTFGFLRYMKRVRAGISTATARRFLCRAALGGAGLLGFALAQAHLMSAGNGAINFRDSDAVVLMAVPVAVLHGVDDNADGLLQEDEIKLHKQEILDQLAQGLSLSVGEKQAHPIEALLMSSVHVEDRPGTPQLEWWSLWSFGENPWANPCTKISVHWFQSGTATPIDIVYSVQVRIGSQTEMVVFGPASREKTFLCDAHSP
jgi:hypothetical protein